MTSRRLILRRLARDIGILLILAAALTGFFLLLNLLVALISSGPQDLLAVTPSEDEDIALPSGVGLLAFGVIALSIILAALVLFVTQSWSSRRGLLRPSVPSVLGELIAIGLVAAGLYIALSGVLSEEITYDQHLAQRSLLQPIGLVIVSALFLSIVIVGTLSPRFLLPLLASWLVVGGVYGFLDTRPLRGLYLFPHPSLLQRPVAYSGVVERHLELRGDDEQTESSGEQSPGNASPSTPDDSFVSLATGLSFGTSDRPSAQPLFRVKGAWHTSFLRTATGDIYENGKWSQLDPVELELLPDDSVLESVNSLIADHALGQLRDLPSLRVNSDLLATPEVVTENVYVDEISITPAGDFECFRAGVVPISLGMTEISVEGTYRPFSATFSVADHTSQYEWRTSIPQYSVNQMLLARPADDLTYLQLPDELPERVRNLAREIGRAGAPHLNAVLIAKHLKQDYTYGLADSESQTGLATEGQDPVDQFLFDSRQCGSGSFSSAFVVLARSIGIPARVVSGWSILPIGISQAVFSNQAYQWAEIALEGLGWNTFNPTPGGPESSYEGQAAVGGNVVAIPQEGRCRADRGCSWDCSSSPPSEP